MSRQNGAKLILQWTQEWLLNEKWKGKIAGAFPSGDFNTSAQDPDNAYGIFTGQHAFSDSQALLPGGKLNQYRYNYSWTDFTGNPKDYLFIDYVLLGLNPSANQIPWSVRSYAILANQFDDSMYNSDHRPVVIDVELLDA